MVRNLQLLKIETGTKHECEQSIRENIMVTHTKYMDRAMLSKLGSLCIHGKMQVQALYMFNLSQAVICKSLKY